MLAEYSGLSQQEIVNIASGAKIPAFIISATIPKLIAQINAWKLYSVFTSLGSSVGKGDLMEESLTIKDIDQQIIELKAHRRELYLKEIAEFKERAAANVGRCFIIDGRYAKVLGVPQEEHTRANIDFNKYQYPALFLAEDAHELVPFYEDTIFSGYWGDGHDPLHSSVQEISNEDFAKEYHRLLQKFQEKIGVV